MPPATCYEITLGVVTSIHPDEIVDKVRNALVAVDPDVEVEIDDWDTR